MEEVFCRMGFGTLKLICRMGSGSPLIVQIIALVPICWFGSHGSSNRNAGAGEFEGGPVLYDCVERCPTLHQVLQIIPPPKYVILIYQKHTFS